MKKLFISSLAFFIGLSGVIAQEKESKKDSLDKENEINLDAVVATGSRGKGRVQTDTPVPVDVFNLKKEGMYLPQVNINQILNSIAPSFTSTVQTVADGTDHIDPAQLRGLGPDQVLVLVNGKRRHSTSYINVNGSPGRGTVGTDLNAIPSFAISKIEVLRDGASAQYGSDAIAGVINLQLKKSKGFDAQLSYGGYLTNAANNHTGSYDGETSQLDLNYGTNIGNGGFLNLTGTLQYRNPTSRAKTYSGSIYNAYNAIEQRAYENGISLSSYFTNINTLADPSDLIGQIKTYANQVGYFDSAFQSQIQSASSISDLQSILTQDVSDDELSYRGLSRDDFNMRVGQSKLLGAQFFYNTEIPLGDNWDLYSFGGYSFRHGEAGAFYRRPNQSRTFTALYPNGFLPEINSDIRDISASVGVLGYLGEWSVDISNTFGQNQFSFETKNTGNTSLRFDSPDSFDAGALRFTQNIFNVDFDRDLNLFHKSNFAMGAEQRHEIYEIIAGEEASYTTYDIYGNPRTSTTTDDELPTNFFGSTLPGGSQGFGGYKAQNATDESRDVYAVYADLETEFTPWLLTDLALRFENYSDFGSTFNYKLASRIKLNSQLNLRFAGSTGFRAPSIHQIYYNNTSTLYFNGELNETGTFSNDSEIAELLGIEKLKEEKSKSVSAGFVYKIPKTNITFTADAYFIRIDDRIVLTSTFSRPSSPTTQAGITLQELFDQADVTSAQFFANAIDTETKGFDVVINHIYKQGNFSLTNDLAFNYNNTRKVGEIHASEILEENDMVDNYFSESQKIYLEKAVPRVKASLSNILKIGHWSAYLRNTFYGEVTSPDTADLNGDGVEEYDEHQIISSKIVTDLSTSYELTKALTLTAGVNNLFDQYPDEVVAENNNSNQFVYSRSTSQFGMNGRYIFLRASLNL